MRRRLETGLSQAVIIAVDPSPHVEQTLNSRDYDLAQPEDYEVARRMALFNLMNEATPVVDLYLHGLSAGGAGVSTFGLGPYRENSPVDPARLILEEAGAKGLINIQNTTKKILQLSSSLHDLHNVGFWAED